MVSGCPTDSPDVSNAVPNVAVSVDVNDLDGDELIVLRSDVREQTRLQLGDVLIAGDWGAKPAKVQVLEISGDVVRVLESRPFRSGRGLIPRS